MPTRSGDGFSFPIRKFDDDVGLFKNFHYLELWLQRLGQGGASYAAVGFDADGLDNWTPGTIEWTNAQVIDDDGLIVGIENFFTEDDSIIRVVPGKYVITFSLDINAPTEASSFEWSNWITDASQLNSSNNSVRSAWQTNQILVGTNTSAVTFTECVSQSFVVAADTDRFHFSSSSLNSTDGFGAEVGNWFVEGMSLGGVGNGTFVTFLKVG